MAEESSNLIKLARKKRHIHLVEKLGKGSLSQKEMDELAEYEKEAEGQVPVLADGTVDLVTIAIYLEKSVKSIRRYVDAGMPAVKNPTGEILRFKVSDAFKWFYSREGYDDGSRTKWDIEYRKNKAKLSEIELKEKERELIPHEEHISILKNQIRGIKAGFLRLPKYVAPRLYQQEPKVICEMLDNELRYIIGQFSGSYHAAQSKQKNS